MDRRSVCDLFEKEVCGEVEGEVDQSKQSETVDD
jgi:hypothetical protein